MAEKVERLSTLRAVGETTATVLVAEVYHRKFETRRHVASFVGLAPSPYKQRRYRPRSRDQQGGNKTRRTNTGRAGLVLAPLPAQSKLSLWWHERFAGKGMRGRKVGIVALARKLVDCALALCRGRCDPGGSDAKSLNEDSSSLPRQR